ncbi:hypothetical protein GGE16_002253 [Rhizobium leguminosarum]|uniref:Uncharacterized protein n=1 Tax=Rhizobium leguminosarum TaxID=384 RepID=A0AAE2MIR9_RHILE|nr:hypothetical protein [Rhizobium leguminosarum]MBB4431315.1 hypothetical protein [Rhizobium esperanzae]MBB4296856.1 hypothetical protein [Rhizobium leguminosarum]MBB4307882.1 hypothetical protein [Rhizobium leguminosarum]MBB4415718.1 hypothetical protein [Rhizobium leguminosarum]
MLGSVLSPKETDDTENRDRYEPKPFEKFRVP